MKKKIAVVFGGQSTEHEVSLKSANQVMNALDKNKYNIIPIAITKSGHWLIGRSGKKYLEDNLKKANRKDGVPKKYSSVGSSLIPKKFPEIDLVLPIMHGSFGEDGRLQGFLDMLKLPYAFSGTLASALAMNKEKTKLIAKVAGVKVAKSVTLKKSKKFDLEEIISKLSLPIVVKPIELGSSVGVDLAKSKTALKNAIKTAFTHGDEILLEQFIKGRELTVAVMGGEKSKVLPVIEIVPKSSSWFNYQAKYKVDGAEEICPADIPSKIYKKAQTYAIKAFESLGCLDLARADFIWENQSENLYFLEINTIPGMTETSLAPQAAKAAGMDFPEFLDKIIQTAVERSKKV